MKGKYGESKNGNFVITDTIGVPHPFCITPEHVAHASDKHCGQLTKECIKEIEENREKRNKSPSSCGIRGCTLRFEEHEQALLVECYADMTDKSGRAVKELHDYLLACKDEAERNNYAGFSFLDKRQ
jgi:hypothetical protein